MDSLLRLGWRDSARYCEILDQSRQMPKGTIGRIVDLDHAFVTAIGGRLHGKEYEQAQADAESCPKTSGP